MSGWTSRAWTGLYLNGYVAKLQAPGGVIWFFRDHRRKPIFSPALFEPIGEKFRRGIRDWAQARSVQMGPGFIKICTYFPYPVKVRVNGHEWAKRQAAAAGIGFTELSNGFASCEDPAALQRICDRFGRTSPGMACRSTTPQHGDHSGGTAHPRSPT